MLERESATSVLLSAQSLFGGGRLPLTVRDVTSRAPTGTVTADAITIAFTLSGWSEVCSEVEVTTLHAGSVLVIPAGVKVSGYPRMDTRMIIFYIDTDYVADHVRWLNRTSLLVHHLQNAVRGDRRVGMFRLAPDTTASIAPQLIRLAGDSIDAHSELSTLAATAAIFAATDRSISVGACRRGNTTASCVSPRKEVEAAVALLQDQIACPWRISKLAQTLSMSPSQLSRLFRRDMGTSPAAFLWRLRTERMAEMLITSDLGVAETSRAVGWANATVGSRAFKRRYGVSPLRYAVSRRNQTESAPPSSLELDA